MNCKLIAKKDFEIYNAFQDGLKVKQGQVFKGKKTKVADDFYTVCIDILGVPTVFDLDVTKQFFEIKADDEIIPLQMN